MESSAENGDRIHPFKNDSKRSADTFAEETERLKKLSKVQHAEWALEMAKAAEKVTRLTGSPIKGIDQDEVDRVLRDATETGVDYADTSNVSMAPLESPSKGIILPQEVNREKEELVTKKTPVGVHDLDNEDDDEKVMREAEILMAAVEKRVQARNQKSESESPARMVEEEAERVLQEACTLMFCLLGSGSED